MSRLVSFYILLGILLFIAILFFRVMAGFLLPLFLALVLVVIFQPVHSRLLSRFAKKPRLAAGLTTMIIAAVVMAPITLVVIFAVSEGAAIVRGLDLDDASAGLEIVRSKLGFDDPHVVPLRELERALTDGPLKQSPTGPADPLHAWKVAIQEGAVRVRAIPQENEGATPWEQFDGAFEALRPTEPLDPDSLAERTAAALESVDAVKSVLLGGKYRAKAITFLSPSEAEIKGMIDRLLDSGLEQKLLQIGASTISIVAQLLFGLAIMLIAEYFFLIDGPTMIENVMRLSPLADDYESELVEEFGKVSRAVVLATLLSAIAQGLLAGIGYWVAGLESTFLLTFLTMLFAMVPFVGATAIWLPASLFLMLTDHMVAGVALAAYGAIPVSMADNIIKPLVLKKHSQIHPLFALLSVIGGVQALGPIGILVGPMIVAFLQTLLNMLHREMSAIEERDSATPSEAPG